MIYKILCIVLIACSLIEAAPPRKSASNAKQILVFDDVEDSVPENLEDLEVRTGTSDNETHNGFPSYPGYNEDLILDPLAADTSRNPSPRPDINEKTTKKSTNILTTKIPNFENHQNTENTLEPNPDPAEPLDHIRKAVFKIIDLKTQMMKEGIHTILEAGKNIFQGGKKSVDPLGFFRSGWNFFGNFGDGKGSVGSSEFEEFSLS